MFLRQPNRVLPWAVGAGAAASASAVAYAVLRGVRAVRRRREELPPGELEELEDSAVDTLRRDSATGVCAIDVAAISPGIIELTGVVPTHEVGQRASRLLHALPGVRTVISRLEVGSFEERLADNRERLARGEPETQDRRWYGVRVGTGRRRQSTDTDPARTDDTVARKTRELEISRDDLEDAASARPTSDAFDPTNPPL
jgi:hypothetical protein